jgi:hypothetical protein
VENSFFKYILLLETSGFWSRLFSLEGGELCFVWRLRLVSSGGHFVVCSSLRGRRGGEDLEGESIRAREGGREGESAEGEERCVVGSGTGNCERMTTSYLLHGSPMLPSLQDASAREFARQISSVHLAER